MLNLPKYRFRNYIPFLVCISLVITLFQSYSLSYLNPMFLVTIWYLVIMVASVLHFISKKRANFQFSTFELVGALYFLYVAFHALITPAFIDPYQFVPLLTFFLLFFILNSFIKGREERFLKFLTILIGFTCFIEATKGIIQFLNILETQDNTGLISGSFSSANVYACFITACLPIVLMAWQMKAPLRNYPKLKPIIISLILLSGIIAIILSQSRTALVSLMITSLLLLSKDPRFSKFFKKNRVIILLGVLIAIIGSVFIKTDSALGRILIWKTTLMASLEKPFLGHGISSFLGQYKEYQKEYLWDKTNIFNKEFWVAGDVKYAFNEYFQIFFEQGIFAIIIFGVMFFLIYKKFLKEPSFQFQCLFCSVFSITSSALFQYNLHSYPTIILLFIVLAILSSRFKTVLQFNIKQKGLYTLSFIFIVLFSLPVYLQIKLIDANQKWEKAALRASVNKWEKAIPLYESAFPVLKYNGYFLYNYGAESYLNSDYPKSISLLQNAIPKFYHSDSYLYLGESHFALGQYNQAEIAYKNAISTVPNKLYQRYRLAQLYKKTGDLQLLQITIDEALAMPVKVPSRVTGEIKAELTEIINNKEN